MNQNKLILVIFLLLVTTFAKGQLSDLAKMDYTRLPKGSSDVGYDRIRGLFNYPIKIKEGSFFLIGLDYSKIELSFDNRITNLISITYAILATRPELRHGL